MLVSQVLFLFFFSSFTAVCLANAAVARFCGQSVARCAWLADRYTTWGKQQPTN